MEIRSASNVANIKSNVANIKLNKFFVARQIFS